MMMTERQPTSRSVLSAAPLALAAILSMCTTTLAHAQVSNEQHGGVSAYAYLEFPGPTPCSAFYVQLHGDATTHKPAGGNAQSVTSVDANYLLYDTCTETVLSSAGGAAQWPGRSGVRVQPTLSSAELHTTLVIADNETQALLPVMVNVTWLGTGNIISQNEVTHSVQPDSFWHSRFIRKYREATPAGVVAFGGVTYDISQATYTAGSLSSINSGYIATAPQ